MSTTRAAILVALGFAAASPVVGCHTGPSREPSHRPIGMCVVQADAGPPAGEAASSTAPPSTAPPAAAPAAVAPAGVSGASQGP